MDNRLPMLGQPKNANEGRFNGEYCATCKFSQVNKDEPSGEIFFCRRFPPQSHLIILPPLKPHEAPRISFAHELPQVTREMWCGEWALKSSVMVHKVIPETGA